jgi:hypothetical protein
MLGSLQPLREGSSDPFRIERKLAKTLSGRVEKCSREGRRHWRQSRFSGAQGRQFGMVEKYNIELWYFGEVRIG